MLKAQRTRCLSSAYQSDLFKVISHFQEQILIKFQSESQSSINFKISTKHQLQNLNQTSASRLNLKFKILTKPSFRISTKIQIHSLYKEISGKILTKLQLENLPEHQLQNLDQASISKSQSNLSISTKTLTSKYCPNIGSESRQRFN